MARMLSPTDYRVREAHRRATMKRVGLSVTAATADLGAALAEVAAATFPLACPPSATAADIVAHVAAHLSEQRFTEYLSDPDRRVLAASDAGRVVGYAMLIRQSGPGPLVGPELSVELSKMYVLASHHGRGAAAALMRAGIAWAGEAGADAVWLGVNQANARAQRFYRKHGFEVAGTRTFQLGEGQERDFIMTRRLWGSRGS